MADSIDSKYFGFVPATEEQQGTSADVFGLGQFVPSAAVVSSSSIGAAAGYHQQQQQRQQQQPQHMANVVKTEQQQQHNEEDGQVDYEQLIPTIPSLLGEDTNSRLDERQQQQMCHIVQLMKTCESIVGQLTRFQNDQNAILGRIVQLETQQQQQQMLANQTTKEPAKLGNAKQQKKAQLKQIYCWDCAARTCVYDNRYFLHIYDLEIINRLTIRYTTTKQNDDWRTVFAKHSIQDSANSNGLFYFEIAIEKLRSQFGAVVGFAVKLKPFVSVVNRWGTLACQSNGIFYVNGYQQQQIDAAHSFSSGDIIGLGIHLTTLEIIFTKNGHRLVTANMFISFPTDQQQQLFPFVSLLSPGDQIDANFGPNFLFANT
ncbi:hypothetical protein niasHT_002474 [Heterodera trifolii]|uniref:B30.2/SPRY domain-containing protein n=1 Tax=Heterodera trifolii TaxID=157864 RepID=A0ABD2LMD7_9BILA